MEVDSNIRQFRDFLTLYNAIAERCFNLCIQNFNRREPNTEETNCVDKCVGKHMSVNHKVMSIYVELQPVYMQRRIDDMNRQAEAQQKLMESVQQQMAQEQQQQPEQQQQQQ